MTAMKLTKLEQETVVTFNAQERVARISTHMKRIITKLDKLGPNCRRIEDISHGETEGYVYELPSTCVSFRNGKLGLMEDADEQVARVNADKPTLEQTCRHGCEKTFASKQGRKNHEINKHGSEGQDA